ncbi:hypothetical protein [Aquimarina longa]|uniref:hypothetical protein n=1 Tax=Aquimarina longa TaxID=1080221 RepID=UPI0007806229|nr:hypothetical protein [Aquimarina longa]
MRIRTVLYRVTRVLLGVFLSLLGVYSVYKYLILIERMNIYFGDNDSFGIDFVKVFVSLIPFGKFTGGLFLTFGIFTRKVLIIVIGGFFVSIVFLWYENYLIYALISLILCGIAILLLKSNNYDKDSCNIMQ